MTDSREDAIASANRTTPEQHRDFAANAARRVGAELVNTIILFDQDPADYRQALIDSFDEAVKRHA